MAQYLIPQNDPPPHMSFAYGASDDKQSIATLEKSLDPGINFWDTADMYGNGSNEVLLSKVLAKHRDCAPH